MVVAAVAGPAQVVVAAVAQQWAAVAALASQEPVAAAHACPGGASPRFHARGGGARFSEAGARSHVAGAPPRRWHGAANWRRHGRPGWGGGYYPYYGYGLGLGLGYGYGYGWGYPYYSDAYYYDAPVVYSGGGGGDAVAYCAQRFKSYDPRTGTYVGRDGKPHPCP